MRDEYAKSIMNCTLLISAKVQVQPKEYKKYLFCSRFTFYKLHFEESECSLFFIDFALHAKKERLLFGANVTQQSIRFKEFSEDWLNTKLDISRLSLLRARMYRKWLTVFVILPISHVDTRCEIARIRASSIGTHR